MNQEEQKQVEEINKIISEDNDKIEESLNKIEEALTKINESVGKVKIYIDTKIGEIQNTYAHKTLYKTQKSLIDTQTRITDTIGQLKREKEKPTTKIYTPLYIIQEEKPDEKEKQEKN